MIKSYSSNFKKEKVTDLQTSNMLPNYLILVQNCGQLLNINTPRFNETIFIWDKTVRIHATT